MAEPSYIEYLRGLSEEEREEYLKGLARSDVASMLHEGVEMDYALHLEELRRSTAELLAEK